MCTTSATMAAKLKIMASTIKLAHEHVSTQGTLAREHVFSMQGMQFSRISFYRLWTQIIGVLQVSSVTMMPLLWQVATKIKKSIPNIFLYGFDSLIVTRHAGQNGLFWVHCSKHNLQNAWWFEQTAGSLTWKNNKWRLAWNSIYLKIQHFCLCLSLCCVKSICMSSNNKYLDGIYWWQRKLLIKFS